MTDSRSHDHFILPASTVLENQRTYENARQKAAVRRWRYEQKHPERQGRGKGGKGHGAVLPIDKPFVCWDGEGPQDTGYSLFGNSEGFEVCHPGPLGTRECLDLIIDTEIANPDAIHIIFGGNYDVSNILCDLPRRKYNQLIFRGSCHWEGYIIGHVPRKWFTVKHGQVTVRIYDIVSFFEGGLVEVLTEWKIGPFAIGGAISIPDETVPTQTLSVPSVSELEKMSEAEIVKVFKKLRSEFEWKDIESIRWYMDLELKYTIQLMNRVRDILYQAGYLPKSWHGPGAIATMAMRRHGVFSAMAKCPDMVREAARFAYAGGRFQDFMAGHARRIIKVFDLKSAYPYFATQLPNLARGSWRWTTRFEGGKFGVYRIVYHHAATGWEDFYRPYPLFRRMEDGSVHFPNRVAGWYWSPEAELVSDSPDAEFLGGWVFDEDNVNDRPFAWLVDYYRRKESAKARGDMVGWVWKKIINSVYGQLARKSGWDRKHNGPPTSHQLEWAGYITSACRASVYKAAIQCGDSLISIDTDGVTSLSGIDNLRIGDSLGDWEYKEYSDGIFWQSGIYFLKTGDDWQKYTAKSRGIPKGTYTAEEVLQVLAEVPEGAEDRTLKLAKKQFIGYRTAMLGGWSKVNTWVTEPMEFLFGGAGKSQHLALPRICAERCSTVPEGMHRLGMSPIKNSKDGMGRYESVPHKLPWLETEALKKQLLSDEYFVDVNQSDGDMVWVKWYKER